MIPLCLKEHLLRTTAAAGLAAALTLFVASSAVAQDTEAAAAATEEEDLIIVTGSRIPRSEFTADNPITVITGEALQNSGFTSIGEALRGELATGSGGFSETSNLSGGGATSVDLRNLGSNAVLVLLNGKRIANFTDALANRATDLSLIPVAMVDRVEILRDGASSTYGADAVSGVINIILKDNFQGVSISGQQGVSTRGDGEQTQLALTLGANFDGGKGNAVLGVEYRYQDPIFQRDRPWAIPVISFLGEGGLNGFVLNGSTFGPGGEFAGDDDAVFCTEPIALGGDELTDVSGSPQGCPSDRLSFNSRPGLDRYDYALEQSLFNGSQLTTTAANIKYDAYDWLKFGVEAQFANRESRSFLDGNPGGLFGTTGVPDGWRVPATNPFNPTGQDGTFFIRPTTTVGPRDRRVEADLFRVVPSAYVDLDVIGLDTWTFELSYIWTKVNAINDSQGIWNLQRANIISDPARCLTDEICVQAFPLLDPTDPADQPFFAMDVFRPANWTQEQIDYISSDERSSSSFELNQWFMLLTGEAFDLPAGPLGVAIGYEFREEQGRNLPDSVTESGESVSNQNFATEGGFNTHEVFAELNIPILKDLQFAKELTVNLQGRWFNFSNFDADTVWKVGVNFAPTEDIRFRYNMGTSFRAPTITDLFGGGTVSFDFVDDPCADVASGPNPANRLANCNAAGIVQPFTQPSAQYPVLAGSNPNLSPEEADTWSAGIILTPRWVEGLQVSVDYYNIEVTNLITRNTLTSVLEACYDSTPVLSAPECNQFQGRSPISGVPIGLVNALINSNDVIMTDGMDWRASYNFNLRDAGVNGDIDVTIDWQGTWLFAHNLYPGKGGADDRGSIVDLEQIAAITLGWNDWTFTWRARYIDDLKDPDFAGDNAFNYTGPTEDYFMEHDIRVSYRWKNVTANFGVNNLFDEEAPYIFSSGNNTDTFTFNTAVVGRYFFGRITADF